MINHRADFGNRCFFLFESVFFFLCYVLPPLVGGLVIAGGREKCYPFHLIYAARIGAEDAKSDHGEGARRMIR